jgi:hypothetical protein
VLALAIVGVAADVFIAGWLVFTFFWEGHHKRCRVELVCPNCGTASSAGCAADRRAEK